MYSQVMPRLAQREHVGFSLEHFNFEDAQAWQLSRSLGTAGAVYPRAAEDEGVGNPGAAERDAAIVVNHYKIRTEMSGNGRSPLINRIVPSR